MSILPLEAKAQLELFCH